MFFSAYYKSYTIDNEFTFDTYQVDYLFLLGEVPKESLLLTGGKLVVLLEKIVW